jgi:hypothetical protein
VTTNAWIMLIATWAVVGGLTVFLVARVLGTPPRE